MKHRLKTLLRDAYAACLYYTGLYLLFSRFCKPRLTILAGHCVRDASNDELPEDMKISSERLEQILKALGKFSRPCTVAEGLAALDGGARGSHVALTMDDGYKDNATVLPALLQRVGAKATVFLESRPLLERRVNWSHKWFWMISRFDVEEVTRQYMSRSSDAATLEKLRKRLESAHEEGADLAYEVKRVFKYDAPAAERDEVMDSIYLERGGDEAQLCERIYMTLQDAREIEGKGIELGGHTVNHHVLSTLPAEQAEREIHQAREELTAAIGASSGQSFAYPFGRHWDYNEASCGAVTSAGFQSAVTTHSGCNERQTDRTRLRRWMIDEETPVSHLVAEACGGFALLRRCGIEFVQ